MPDNRDEAGKFVPGKSGNPGGRPKKLEALRGSIYETVPRDLKKLDEIIECGEHRDAIAAIRLKWGYGFGSPATVVTGVDGESVPIGVVMLPTESGHGSE